MRKLMQGSGLRRRPEGNPDPMENPAEEVAVAPPPPAPDQEGPMGKFLKVRGRIPRPDPKWNQRTVTVSLDKDQIHVVVFKGKRVTAWASSPLPHGPVPAPEGGGDAPEGSLQETLAGLGIRPAGRFWKAADKIGFRRGRVVMDLSLYSTLLRHLQIPRVRPRYLEPVVLSEVLESLPFSQDEVDINWQLQKSEEGQSVFAIALPREKVDHQVRLVREAGLTPAAAYSKASALALASGLTDGILVHQSAGESALVLVLQGTPRVVHQLEFESPEKAPKERAAALARAIEQVAGYYQPAAAPANLPADSSGDPSSDSPGPSKGPVQDTPLPVVLTGLSSSTDPVIQALLPLLRRRVVNIEPQVRYPDDFPVGTYATNVGLFLADRRSTSGRPSDAPSETHYPLNLLPRRHQPRPLPALPAAVFIILLLLAIHPINVTERVEAKAMERDAIAQHLEMLQAQERSLDVILVTHQENNQELESVRAQTASLEGRLEQLQDEVDTLLNRLFTITDEARPLGVELSSVTPLGQGYSVSGVAGSHADALRYVANLRSSPLFEEARIVRLDGQGGASPDSSGNIGFQVRLTLAAEDGPPEDGQ